MAPSDFRFAIGEQLRGETQGVSHQTQSPAVSSGVNATSTKAALKGRGSDRTTLIS